ncbi:hypothetical protein EVAR_2367_1 [Eumeta japonica]|uniref:Uncharacterized protein n=1 Tax=Eumeta variegata TaxID=151549 RepID=A0A4C1SG68_EUMVA|nr:hypothetical protein EVAR_2367_1 [Eumeta japonica]
MQSLSRYNSIQIVEVRWDAVVTLFSIGVGYGNIRVYLSGHRDIGVIRLRHLSGDLVRVGRGRGPIASSQRHRHGRGRNCRGFDETFRAKR